TGGARGVEALEDCRQGFLQSPYEEQGRASVDGSRGKPVGEPLFRCEAHLLLSSRQRLGPEPTALKHPVHAMERDAEAVRMLDLAAQLIRLTADPEGPVGKSQVPQRHREVRPMRNPGIRAGVT